MGHFHWIFFLYIAPFDNKVTNSRGTEPNGRFYGPLLIERSIPMPGLSLQESLLVSVVRCDCSSSKGVVRGQSYSNTMEDPLSVFTII